MRIAIVGGRLQGTEAVYLAGKAGFDTLVIDRDPKAAAADLCDRFIEFEFRPGSVIPEGCPRPDLILPALEDLDVLTMVETWAATDRIPLAFDLRAYTVTESKLRSDALFSTLGLPAPGTWPDCPWPVLVKPDSGSGSEGVRVIQDSRELEALFPTRESRERLVIQEFMEGPSFSIEVIGQPGAYQALAVTDLGMDAAYDCCRVTAPTCLDKDRIREFEDLGVRLAEAIGLRGLMDVEVILNQERLRLLEIDARFPSQTPMAVFHSTGINMVSLLADLFIQGRLPDVRSAAAGPGRHVIVEHVRVENGIIERLGEHIMAGRGPLSLETGFFGADEALTDYTPGSTSWVATLMLTGDSPQAVSQRQEACWQAIQDLSARDNKESW